MRITQGTFSFLPDLTDDEIRAQVDYALGRGWALSVEYSDDPHPRNVYWEMWGLPMFTVKDGAAVLFEVNAFDNTRGVESMCLSFIVNRPKEEPGFGLQRQEAAGRMVRYTTQGYAAQRPAGARYE
jgi:ribulose-bisphosphate carboxylase small chain